MTLFAFLGIRPRASEPSFDISGPTKNKKNDSTEIEQLTKEIIQLSGDVSKASPSQLETKYSAFREAVKKREKFTCDEEWAILPIEAEKQSLEFIDDKLSQIKAKLSETNAHKAHVLKKLGSLRDVLLTHVTEEGIFRLSGGTSAIISLAGRLEKDPKADLNKESRDTLVSVFKQIVKGFGGEHSSLLEKIQEELLRASDITTLKSVVKKLGFDSPEYKITKLVIGLLSETAKSSGTNQMDPIKLAICMAQNLFSIADPIKALATTPIVQSMIENYSEIFA
ncbi:MAG: hypothetical protein KR126chlam3_00148 [Chlamydiae bacterium]|nr:hypothetical protein [Chlamydiota bacterium]